MQQPFYCRSVRVNEYSYHWVCYLVPFRHRHALYNDDMDSVTSTSVPIYEIWIQATHSDAVATFFVCLLAIIAFFALNGCQQTASRLTWAFARDDALIMSRLLSRIHPSLQVPVYALVANAGIVFIIGCIYLASSTAFNALIGTGLILQQVSFVFPAALLLYRRRSSTYLPPSRRFRLGWLGWISNAMTIAFGVIALVFYCFPAEFPVSGGNMSMRWIGLVQCMIWDANRHLT